MSTLDIRYLKKQALVYLAFSILILVFGRVYEMFSHEVYSSFMMNAYLIPLIMGGLVSLVIYLLKIKNLPSRLSINLYNAGVATFTIYSVFRGVLEIYGTTNSLINVYLYVGIIMVLLSIILFIKKLN